MDQDLKAARLRIVEALDRLAPPALGGTDFDAAEAYVWHASGFFRAPSVIPSGARDL